MILKIVSKHKNKFAAKCLKSETIVNYQIVFHFYISIIEIITNKFSQYLETMHLFQTERACSDRKSSCLSTMHRAAHNVNKIIYYFKIYIILLLY